MKRADARDALHVDPQLDRARALARPTRRRRAALAALARVAGRPFGGAVAGDDAVAPAVRRAEEHRPQPLEQPRHACMPSGAAHVDRGRRRRRCPGGRIIALALRIASLARQPAARRGEQVLAADGEAARLREGGELGVRVQVAALAQTAVHLRQAGQGLGHALPKVGDRRRLDGRVAIRVERRLPAVEGAQHALDARRARGTDAGGATRECRSKDCDCGKAAAALDGALHVLEVAVGLVAACWLQLAHGRPRELRRRPRGCVDASGRHYR